jgi:hypothetical protein
VRRLLSELGGGEARRPDLDRCADCPLRDAPATVEVSAPATANPGAARPGTR